MNTIKETSAPDLARVPARPRALPLPGLEQLWVLLALTLIGVHCALPDTAARFLVAPQGRPDRR